MYLVSRWSTALLGWTRGEVAFLGADFVARIVGLEVDGAEGAIHSEICRPIDEVVLAAELLFNVAEADGYVFELRWVEGLAAGRVGDGLEDIVTLVFAWADVGADGVDDGVGALAHLDGVGLLDAGVVVVTVGDKDEGAADGGGLLEGEHLVFAGFVESVEEGGTAAGTELADALVEKVDVVGEVLGDVGFDVEALDEGAVVTVEDLEEELDGRVLLELEALADGAGGVEHDADAQGEIGLLGEAEDGSRGAAVVEEAEVLALEAGDELAVLVGDGEDEIHFVDADDDVSSAGGWSLWAGQGLVCGGCLGLVLCCRGRLLRCGLSRRGGLRCRGLGLRSGRRSRSIGLCRRRGWEIRGRRRGLSNFSG